MSATRDPLAILVAKHELMGGQYAVGVGREKRKTFGSFVCKCGEATARIEGVPYYDLHATHVAEQVREHLARSPIDADAAAMWKRLHDEKAIEARFYEDLSRTLGAEAAKFTPLADEDELNDRFADLYSRLDAERESDVAERLSLLLSRLTGGLLSKPCYSVATMTDAIETELAKQRDTNEREVLESTFHHLWVRIRALRFAAQNGEAAGRPDTFYNGVLQAQREIESVAVEQGVNHYGDRPDWAEER